MPVIHWTFPWRRGPFSLCVDQAQEPDLRASRFSGSARHSICPRVSTVSFGWDGPDGTRKAVGAVSLPVTRDAVAARFETLRGRMC